MVLFHDAEFISQVFLLWNGSLKRSCFQYAGEQEDDSFLHLGIDPQNGRMHPPLHHMAFIQTVRNGGGWRVSAPNRSDRIWVKLRELRGSKWSRADQAWKDEIYFHSVKVSLILSHRQFSVSLTLHQRVNLNSRFAGVSEKHIYIRCYLLSPRTTLWTDDAETEERARGSSGAYELWNMDTKPVIYLYADFGGTTRPIIWLAGLVLWYTRQIEQSLFTGCAE